MHQVLLSLGANYDAESNLPEARLCLEQVLLFPHYTPAIWTEPINSKLKNKYLNQLVKGQTRLGFPDLSNALKAIEKQLGRTDEDRQQGIVRIDLDILEFDGIRHHLRDWERPYVQLLLPQF